MPLSTYVLFVDLQYKRVFYWFHKLLHKSTFGTRLRFKSAEQTCVVVFVTCIYEVVHGGADLTMPHHL